MKSVIIGLAVFTFLKTKTTPTQKPEEITVAVRKSEQTGTKKS
jgi:hypothetical protein